jgi:hypothetical protein
MFDIIILEFTNGSDSAVIQNLMIAVISSIGTSFNILLSRNSCCQSVLKLSLSQIPNFLERTSCN